MTKVIKFNKGGVMTQHEFNRKRKELSDRISVAASTGDYRVLEKCKAELHQLSEQHKDLCIAYYDQIISKNRFSGRGSAF